MKPDAVTIVVADCPNGHRVVFGELAGGWEPGEVIPCRVFDDEIRCRMSDPDMACPACNARLAGVEARGEIVDHDTLALIEGAML